MTEEEGFSQEKVSFFPFDFERREKGKKRGSHRSPDTEIAVQLVAVAWHARAIDKAAEQG